MCIYVSWFPRAQTVLKMLLFVRRAEALGVVFEDDCKVCTSLKCACYDTRGML